MARILIVDDDAGFTTALSKILKGEGHSTSEAGNAPEAVELLKKEKFDMVFADLSMPGASGIALLEDIKKDSPSLPVVIITAFGDWDVYAEAVAKGAHSFVNKPVKKEEILQIIKSALG